MELAKQYFGGDTGCQYYDVTPRRSMVMDGAAGVARLFSFSNVGIVESTVPDFGDGGSFVAQANQLVYPNPNLNACYIYAPLEKTPIL